MNIKSFAVSQTGRLHLRDADEELMYANGDIAKPMVVTLFGPGSKQYAAAQAAQSNRLIDKLKKKGKTQQTAEQAAAEKAEFLADCTMGWENVDYDKLSGRELSVAIYSDTTLGFVADQVAKFLGEWGNFSKGSATS